MPTTFGGVAADGFPPTMVISYHAFQTVGWANMPAAENFFRVQPDLQTAVDLTKYTQVRLFVTRGSVAAAAGSKLFLKYAAGGAYQATAANFVQIGTASVEVAINVTDTILDTGWVDLAAGAKGLSTIAVTGSGGDGVADPQVGAIHIHFR